MKNMLANNPYIYVLDGPSLQFQLPSQQLQFLPLDVSTSASSSSSCVDIEDEGTSISQDESLCDTDTSFQPPPLKREKRVHFVSVIHIFIKVHLKYGRAQWCLFHIKHANYTAYCTKPEDVTVMSRSPGNCYGVWGTMSFCPHLRKYFL